ncbi:hypothetical protein [Caldimonas sp. KR1-144]|uniref:phosphatase domain-containing protein n=1 Tax=Caldimonas sp. KR1-144 TaxID=3400911 RepID=UPI003C0A9BFA
MRPLYIFDLDGTLADITHRRHFVDGTGPEKSWPKFFAACVDDKPIPAVIRTMAAVWAGSLTSVWIWSGRSDEVEQETREWLIEHTIFGDPDAESIQLKMRRAGDYTPDEVLKQSWLDALSPEDRSRIVAVFDDRDRVVEMWRRNGIPCFQVAPGDF